MLEVICFFQLQKKTLSLLGYPEAIPNMKFEHFGIFHFLSYAADKQNKQTDRAKYSTHADSVNLLV